MIMKNILYGVIVGIVLFLVLGIPTALIPTGLFTRMIMPTLFDYIFLLLVPVLFGLFVVLYFRNKEDLSNKKTCAIAGGVATGWFAVFCPICISLLVYLFGASVLLTYLDPIRPIFGALSVVILIVLIYYQIKGKCLYGKRKSKN